MREPILYRILIPINKLFMSLYRVEYRNRENIINNEPIILAGNHTSYLDPLLLMSSTNRCIHFLGKIELFKGFKKYFFKSVGVIPVNRATKNPDAISLANDCLKNNMVVGIFPEGTINRSNEIILPFKSGAVRFAYFNNVKIVPFSITGKYKLFKKSIIITYGSPYNVTGNVEFDKKKLEDKVIRLMRSN